MAAKCHPIVRELIHKQMGYPSLKKSQFINQFQRNYHCTKSDIARTKKWQPAASSSLVETTRINKDLVIPFQSKLLNTQSKINSASAVSRFYSTNASPFFIQKRFMGKKKWGNQADEKCEEEKPKCPAQPCPKWVMRNCPPQKPQKGACNVVYKDPCCKKKLAPYPSYSETCAERLADDPSECMQCPWAKCGGVENIKSPAGKK